MSRSLCSLLAFVFVARHRITVGSALGLNRLDSQSLFVAPQPSIGAGRSYMYCVLGVKENAWSTPNSQIVEKTKRRKDEKKRKIDEEKKTQRWGKNGHKRQSRPRPRCKLSVSSDSPHPFFTDLSFIQPTPLCTSHAPTSLTRAHRACVAAARRLVWCAWTAGPASLSLNFLGVWFILVLWLFGPLALWLFASDPWSPLFFFVVVHTVGVARVSKTA